MMMFVWHRVEIRAELQTDRTVRAEMGAKLRLWIMITFSVHWPVLNFIKIIF